MTRLNRRDYLCYERKERMRAVHVDNFGAMIGIRNERISNKIIKELVCVNQGVDEIMNESTMKWY